MSLSTFRSCTADRSSRFGRLRFLTTSDNIQTRERKETLQVKLSGNSRKIPVPALKSPPSKQALAAALVEQWGAAFASSDSPFLRISRKPIPEHPSRL